MVKRRLSKKKGGALANAWTRQQVNNYLLDQNNGNETWLSRNDSQDKFFVNDFEIIDPSEDGYSHTIVNGKNGWTIMTKWLLEDPELGIPMMREDIEDKLNKHGWEVEPDGSFDDNTAGFRITKSIYTHMLNKLHSNNNSSNVSLENVPFISKSNSNSNSNSNSKSKSKSKSKTKSKSNSNSKSKSKSNRNPYNGRKKNFSKKRSKKKPPMVIRNGNVVMCKSNSN